jgi:WD40 repeat protein
MEQLDHTIVQDVAAQQAAQQLSLQSQPQPASDDGAPELPGYVLRHRLGRGSFGEVWAATQSGSGQAVAIKIFTSHRGLDFRYLQHEIKRLRQVAEHPHVVTLLDADFRHEPPFFCMGLYQQSLAAWRQQHSEVDLEQAVCWFHQMVQALRFTHEKGLLHCDLKPANVLLDAEQRVKLADFGQAVERGLPGSAVGSLGYMAPEQASLETSCPDVRWDIYGVGATMYYLLTGRPPRLSDQSRETMGSITDPTERLHRYREVIANSPLTPLKQLVPSIDGDLEYLITSCLSLEPAGRPQSAAELLEDLARRKDGRPLLCKRPWSFGYRVRRYARRHALGLSLVALVLLSGGAAASEYYQRAEAQRRTMAMHQFDMGWQVARQGRTAEAALWWARALETYRDIPAARAALDSVSLKLVNELHHGDGAITTLASSPDGKWLASADSEGVLRVWQEGQPVVTISGLRKSPVDAYAPASDQFAFTPDSQYLVTTLGLYPVGSDTPTLSFQGDVAIDPQGRGALLVSPSGARLFRSDNLQLESPLSEPPRSPVTAVAFGTEPGSLAVLGADGKVDLYAHGKKLASGLHEQVGAIAYSPDGKLLVTCSEDRTARLYDAYTGQLRRTLEHGWRVTNALFSRDGSRLLTTLYNGEVRLWDVESGLALMHSPMRHSWFAYGISCHGPTEMFASYGVDGRARVWQASGEPYSPWYEHGGPIRDTTFTEGGRLLATAGQDGKIRLWEVGEERRESESVSLQGDAEIGSLSLSPSGEQFAVAWNTFPQGGGAMLLSRDGQQRTALGPPDVRSSMLLFSPDGKSLALAGEDGKARLFSSDGRLLREVTHPAAVLAVGFSPDNQTLMSASRDGTVTLSTLERSRNFQLTGSLTDARMSADGRLVGACSDEGKVVVWDLSQGQEVFSTRHPSPLRRLAFDQKGSRLVICGQDGVARLIELSSGEEKVLTHDLMVTNASFDSRGARLVTTSLDGAVKVWDSTSGQLLPSPEGHQGPVLLAQFSPDDELILSVSKDGKAQLWEASSGLPFGLPVRHHSVAYDGAFSRDGKVVITGGFDGIVRLTAVPLKSGAPLPSTDELEATLGSRLAFREGKTVCESVPRQVVKLARKAGNRS